MKVAIVGTSKLTQTEQYKAVCAIHQILNSYTSEIEVISGGAEGIDTLAIEIAHSRRLNTEIIYPRSNDWEGYKRRNKIIADTHIHRHDLPNKFFPVQLCIPLKQLSQ